MNITTVDKGRTLCVTGTVISSYWDYSGPMPVFYIIFGKGSGDFYMVNYNGYFENLNGKCVRATGKIEQVGVSAYMVIANHKLDLCW